MSQINPLPIEIRPASSKSIGDGEQHIYRFSNGYGASVVRHDFSYGGRDGLYELAVITFTADGFDLTYDTPITGDVLGWLTVADVAETLARIAALGKVSE